jgi:hypothetical protein
MIFFLSFYKYKNIVRKPFLRPKRGFVESAPELVAPGQLLERPLVQEVEDLGGRILARLDVAQPRLERVRVSQQLLLERKI